MAKRGKLPHGFIMRSAITRRRSPGRLACDGGKRFSASLDQIPRLRVQVRKILVPIDFSAGSKQALLYAFPMAHLFKASVSLVHVVEPACGTVDYGYGEVAREWPDVRLVKLTQAKLRALSRRLRSAGVQTRSVVRSGTAFAEIVAAAEQLKADLIIIATRGLSCAKEGIIGSVAERVARHATCPVLVVRRLEHEFIKLPRSTRR